MQAITRRRFIAISAAAVGLAASPARAASLYEWRGVALGAAASIHLAHPDAAAIVSRAVAEISRLEAVFSLYQAGSVLSQLNAAGSVQAPPFELLECLALCGQVHEATEARFDPTVQPLWALYALSYAQGRAPTAAEIATARAHLGWADLRFDSGAVQMRAGMALTLNGVAQGYIADRVAELLRAEGLTDVLINTGELRAIGGMPGGGDWPVHLDHGGALGLNNRALATSANLGTTFDTAGKVGHILDPRTGHPADMAVRQVSISAESAALADALSTAACLMQSRAQIETALSHFPDARLEGLITA